MKNLQDLTNRLNRINFSDNLKDEINSIVNEYYPNFDGAHNLDHANDVIDLGIKYAKEYCKEYNKNLNMDIVYASCALHDVGLSVNRDTHEQESGKLIRTILKPRLLNYFSEEEIEEIAVACEDHRASNKNPPRTIYGKIVSQADRSLCYSRLINY